MEDNRKRKNKEIESDKEDIEDEEEENEIEDENENKKSKIDENVVDINHEEEALQWLKDLGPKDFLNEKLFDQNYLDESHKEFKVSKPFPYLFIEDIFDDTFLDKILEEISHEEMNARSNDMYDFHQSHDLKTCKRPLINKMKEIMYGEEFRNALGKICGIELYKYTEEVSMSAAVYERGDKLLCHDDQLEGRRLAYVLYLVDRDWDKEDGGSLDLFESEDGLFASTKIAKSIVPKWNSIIIFEVSEKSFHQVSEVLSDKSRISISGWFHGPPVERKKRPEDVPLLISPLIVLEDGLNLLKEWVNPTYLKPSKLLQRSFGEDSSLQLRKFLNENNYNKLFEEIKTQKWEEQGPPNKVFFNVIKNCDSPLASSVLKLFGSDAFGKLLNDITSMEMTGCSTKFKKFSQNNYTLLYDDNVEQKNEALDVVFCFVNKNWNDQAGGEIHYVAPGEENELLCLDPTSNTLNLVYRAPGDNVMSFVKYVNQFSQGNSVYYLESIFRVKED